MTTTHEGRTVRQEVAARVRAQAADSQISVRALAAKVGMDYSAMLRRTRAQVDFTASEVVTVADALGVDASALMPSRRSQDKAVAS